MTTPSPYCERHGRNANVDASAPHLDVEASVLGKAPFGDVEAAHQLEPRDEGADDPLLLHHLLVQYPVDALADAQNLFVGLDVNIRRPHLHRVLKERAQQADDRRILHLRGGQQLGEIDAPLTQLFVQFLGDVDDILGAPINAVDGAQQLGFAHHRLADRALEQFGQFVVGEDVGGIGHADQGAGL